jgi:hypothetical protein
MTPAPAASLLLDDLCGLWPLLSCCCHKCPDVCCLHWSGPLPGPLYVLLELPACLTYLCCVRGAFLRLSTASHCGSLLHLLSNILLLS